MSDQNSRPLDATKGTAEFSASSTIGKYDYKLENSEYGLISSHTQSFDSYWEENNNAIQLCMKKLNALKGNVQSNEIENCFRKMKDNFKSFYNL
jgi:hypothetical protein